MGPFEQFKRVHLLREKRAHHIEAICAKRKKGIKLLADALALDDRQEKFQTAEDTFFRASVLLNNQSAPALRNLALVLTHIQKDFKAADRMYARSLKLDMYDESTQINYIDFLLRHQIAEL